MARLLFLAGLVCLWVYVYSLYEVDQAWEALNERHKCFDIADSGDVVSYVCESGLMYWREK